MNDQNDRPVWGYLGLFPDEGTLIAALGRLRSAGIEHVEVFTPFPVPEVDQALGWPRSPMPWFIAAGGLVGGAAVFGLEVWVSVYAYPLNIGGRPLLSWPSFVPPAFEGVVLGATAFAVLGLLWLCRLPRLHHPVFEVEAFRRASVDGFFVAVVNDTNAPDGKEIVDRLKLLGASDVGEVPEV